MAACFGSDNSDDGFDFVFVFVFVPDFDFDFDFDFNFRFGGEEELLALRWKWLSRTVEALFFPRRNLYATQAAMSPTML